MMNQDLPNPKFNLSDNESQILSAIDELAHNTEEMIRARRKTERHRIDAAATLVPGNLSDRQSSSWSGICHDISPTGCRLVLDRPILVGDIFLLTIDTTTIDVDPTFVRCIRCHMLREDSYECGVSFFAEIQVGPARQTSDDFSL